MTDRIGISLSRHMQAVSGLMIFADQAIYRAKQSGNNRFQFFQESQQVIEANRVTVVAEAGRECASLASTQLLCSKLFDQASASSSAWLTCSTVSGVNSSSN